jgi:hypothetical protein
MVFYSNRDIWNPVPSPDASPSPGREKPVITENSQRGISVDHEKVEEGTGITLAGRPL